VGVFSSATLFSWFTNVAAGEKDEALEELQADLADIKENYRGQIEFMAEQLMQLQGQDGDRDGASHGQP
jgi:hypothetical protein